MTYEFIRVSYDGPVTTITLNRPDVMNALHAQANAELHQVFDDFAADPDQWIGIVTGAGERAFSAGNDLKAQAAGGGAMPVMPPTGFGGICARFGLNKPLIAAVNGVAMGGGFEIALACDLIVASETAIFALPEPRVGLAALGGGLLRLSQQIPLKQAMGMILTGRRVTAAEGLELGFINEVVPPGELMGAARRWAGQILECSPMSVRASKQTVYRGFDEPSFEDAARKQRHYPATAAMLTSEDLIEGPLAFSQKRPPHWKGR